MPAKHSILTDKKLIPAKCKKFCELGRQFLGAKIYDIKVVFFLKYNH